MKTTRLLFLKALLVVGVISLSACITPNMSHRDNVCQSDKKKQKLNQMSSKQKEKTCHYYGNKTPYMRGYIAEVASKDTPATKTITSASDYASFTKLFNTPLLSVGDRVSIKILNGDEFSAKVEVNADGFIYLPYLPALKAHGVSIPSLKKNIKQLLVDENLMLEGAIRLSITPLRWAPIQVSVSGAVFEPGLHSINRKSDTEIKDDDGGHSGDQAAGRSIYMALKASGGISPNADISRIVITRGRHIIEVDLTGVINGDPVPRLTLMAEDHIHVPQNTHFDDSLARPSQITAPGIRVFISNLTQPASSNAQSAVDTEATRFPYGTRLLTGVIGGNCVGGAQSTNASRHVVLVTKNPITQEVDVVERSVDVLMSQSWKSHINPVLLPGDGIACYDSGVTNIREIARTITEIIVPATLLGIL
ncbi:polysaccharide biosynthesis/export family protein [Shewanella woodyi]|uniref:Polysaccharide export protein n=1 Tax=Shewanella woodyi (strain ATCC 51908 / MS32) TaxID=392500 RepID=B1KMI6_SHEWM|nr:polysaccharide biosynthesis/export family protein [Shewanella woodyi]ACA85984.1 polysaccharide export protein [Shewanella woodyi ATCC 51908]